VSSTDFNDNATSYAHDSLGRLVNIVRPYDTPAYPLVEYTYALAVPAGANGLVNFVETRRHDKSSLSNPKSEMYFFSREFVDGLGRKLMTKTEAEPAPGSATPRVILSEATLYNARQKPACRSTAQHPGVHLRRPLPLDQGPIQSAELDDEQRRGTGLSLRPHRQPPCANLGYLAERKRPECHAARRPRLRRVRRHVGPRWARPRRPSRATCMLNYYDREAA